MMSRYQSCSPSAVSLLDKEPLPSGAEKEAAEIEVSYLTLLDLLQETWDSSYSATCNLRLLIASISRYLCNQRKIDPTVRRMREGLDLRSALVDVYRYWLKRGPLNRVTSKYDLNDFVRHTGDSNISSLFLKGRMSEDTFNEWLEEYHLYLNSVEGGRKKKMKNTSMETVGEEDQDEEIELSEGGLDALFKESSDKDASEKDKNDALDRMQQCISKSENGRLITVRSPGECGSQLIRVYVHDVKDIATRDKRHWWKYAKLRAQFLTSGTRTDRKEKLLRRLLDTAADDLKKIPGGVQTEVRNVTFECENVD